MPKHTLRCAAIAAALLERGLDADRPVAILSGNDIEHALLGLAAMHVGIPYAPISVPYSLLSQDFGKLKAIVEVLGPGLVFAANGGAFARAIAAALPHGVEIVVTNDPPPGARNDFVRATHQSISDGGRGNGACARPARWAGQNPFHLWFDRTAERR